MTARIYFIEDGIGAELIASGHVLGEEVIAALEELYRDDRYESLRYLIVDKSECAKYEVSGDDVKVIAKLDMEAAKRNPNLIEAHVAPHDDQFGVSRMWQVFAEESRAQTEIFRDRPSADEWIAQQLEQN